MTGMKLHYLPWPPIVALLLLFAGCLEGGFTGTDRGADENVRTSGRKDRGNSLGNFTTGGSGGGGRGGTVGRNGAALPWQYQLSYSSIVLSPDGRYLLGAAPLPGPDQGFSNPGLVLVAQRLEDSQQTIFWELQNVARINFSPQGDRAYLLEQGGMSIAVLDLNTMTLLPERFPLSKRFGALDVSPLGRFLVASNLPTTDFDEALAGVLSGCGGELDRCSIELVDLTGGSSGLIEMSSAIRDLDWSPVHYEMVLTLIGTNPSAPSAQLAFVSPVSHETQKLLTIPNCADELKIQPGGTLALLSPVSCSTNGKNFGLVLNPGRFDNQCPDPNPVPPPKQTSYDPISVIDLDKRVFVENLPGFGPVVISPDGHTAVGFTRRSDMIEQWGYNQQALVGLIKVDLDTLDWTVTEYGDFEPSYLMSPDGQWLYTYNDGQFCTRVCAQNQQGYITTCTEAFANLTRWSLDTMTGVSLSGSGANAHLRELAFTADGSEMYAVDNQTLYRVPIGGMTATAVSVPFFPDLLNVSADNVLVLGRRDSTELYVMPTSGGAGKAMNFSL